MNTEEFNKVINERTEKIKKILTSKAKEYANQKTDDRLHNFNKGSKITGQQREDVLMGFAMKHWISVTDILDKMREGQLPSKELLDEKLGDWIIYMCILEASIIDKIENGNS